MTEPIKQEIINNIFENGDKLITGPILQTVLIDMIDDVNVKDQEILSKTGSWDDAATQIPNLATKAELTEAKDNLQANITNLSESVARDLENVEVDLTGYATETWVESQGYLKEHQDISNLATKTELTEAENNLQGNITNLSESVARDIANVDVDLTGYATEQWVESKGYLTEHQDISNLATKVEVTSLSESVARDIANVSVPEGVATEAWVQSQDYASKSYVDNAVSSVDLTGYATETWVEGQGYLKEHQDISNLATKGELNSVSESVQTDISNLATKTELNDTKGNLETNMLILSESMAKTIDDYTAGIITEIQNQDYASKSYVNEAVSSSSVDLTGYATETWVQSQSYLTEHQDISNLATKTELNDTKNNLQGNITNLSESVANSAVWKKGTGKDSIVQVLSGDNEADTPTATRPCAVAIGSRTAASGFYSHAEGYGSVASGVGSHAEGSNTTASGFYSHAEGNNAKALGDYSHAEGGWTKASGSYSHAEGSWTKASGSYSHAEGYETITSNDYEHAQGRYNHNSENQIFSVGAGENINYNITRRNAVSILVVPNTETQINTASFFVQNIGGYDGTNPTPGTNDLATVINGMSTGGGSSETLWKKGTGEDSIVQKLSGDNEAKTPTATGTGSIAIGSETTASGQYSHAEGDGTNASGESSHAEGFYTKASGMYSHAEGWDTKASGEKSHAEGQSTNASGVASHAEGWYTVASGMYSHAEGYNTDTLGSYSHAEGRYTSASNDYEHAQGRYNHNSENQIFSIGTGNSDTDRRNAVSVLEVDNSGSYTSSFFVQNIGGYDGTNPTPGTNDLATVINGLSSGGGSSETLWKKGEGTGSIVQVTTGLSHYEPKATGERAIATGYDTNASGENSHAEGNGTRAGGSNSHAEGGYTVASGSYSHAEGQNTKALGNFGSHAEGRDTIASGYGSHAEGQETTASANYSHAEGGSTETSGWYSHAEGTGTKASGWYSHAEGNSTNASGFNSHAEGTGTKASNDSEHAQGRYNHNSSNQIFSVGTGNSNTDRRNAVSVLEVSNNNSYTSSLFVQNIGGYDGTNPTPGTNDLATVLNNTETWTFTLEDGSTVTKKIILG